MVINNGELHVVLHKSDAPIQELAIPAIIKGKDLIACAQTGTGKTAAFLLPVLHNMYTNNTKSGTQTLIVCPTRELAVQIEQEVQGFSYFLGINTENLSHCLIWDIQNLKILTILYWMSQTV